MLYGASVITVVLPGWYLTLPKEKRRSPAVKARLAVEIGVSKALLGFNFGDIRITWAGEDHQDCVGRSVSEIAASWGVSDLDAYIRLVDDTEGRGRVLVRASGTEPLVRVMIEGPDQHEMDQDVYTLAKLIEKKLNG